MAPQSSIDAAIMAETRKTEKNMSIARIIWCVSLLGAVVLAFADMEMGGAILAVLGLASGFFVDREHRTGLIIAAVFF